MVVLLAATAFAGLLAGASLDRYLVQVPAWRRLNVMTWAEHSRYADLGNGRFWYPTLAFAATGLSIAAILGARGSPAGIGLPLVLAALSEFLGLLVTILAAPNLLRLRRPQDRSTTERAFRLFHRWGILRAAFQVSAFPLLLWTIGAMIAT
jgi:hypothetical protein